MCIYVLRLILLIDSNIFEVVMCLTIECHAGGLMVPMNFTAHFSKGCAKSLGVMTFHPSMIATQFPRRHHNSWCTLHPRTLQANIILLERYYVI
jgi:hypothetical protein